MIFDLQLFAGEATGYFASVSGKTITIGGTSVDVGSGITLLAKGAVSGAATSWIGYSVSGNKLTGLPVGASDLANGTIFTDAVFALGGAAVSSYVTTGGGTAALSLAVGSGDYTYVLNDSKLANLSVMDGDGAKFEIIDVATAGLSINAFNSKNATFTFKNTTNVEKIYFENTTNTLSSSKAVVIGNSDGAFSLTGSGAVMKGNLDISSKSSGAVTLTAAGVAGAAGAETLNISGAGVAVSLSANNGVTSKISDTTANVSLVGAGGTSTITLESAKKVAFNATADASLNVAKMDDSSALDVQAASGKKATVTLSGGGIETITLGDKGTAKGSVVGGNVKESAGDTSEGNTLVLGTAVKNVSLSSVVNGVAQLSGDSIGTATLTSSEASDARQSFGINLKGTDTTVSTLFMGNGAQNTVAKTDFEEFGFIVGGTTKTINLGDSASKDNWFFGRSYIGDKTNTFFTDKAYYKDIVSVIGSNAKSELIVNGSETGMKLTANGAGDTLWGGDNGVADTLVSAGSVRTEFATGSYDGKDVIQDFRAGGDTSALSSSSDILHILGGVGVLKAESSAFTIGENANNNAKISMADSVGGTDMYLTFGLNGENKIARVDVSSAGQAMTYNKNANYYIGQGSSSSLVINSADGAVEIGYEDNPGLINVAALNGSAAAAGSVLVGSNNRKTDVTASATGASSVVGGFIVTDGVVNDAYNDNLIGSGNSSVATTFMVGQYMGDDKITQLSTGDTIQFLNTKIADITLEAPSKNATKFTFATAGGATVTASSDSKLSAIKNITLQADDGSLMWDGSEWKESN